MKKVILNQISKAVAGGSNYFYLPLHVVGEGKDVYYETSADLSKLFELDSNNVPVVKEICVYDEDHSNNVYLSYCDGKADIYKYMNKSNNDKINELTVDKTLVTLNSIVVVEQSTDDDSPKDGGK